MTRKDYILIAEVLKEGKATDNLINLMATALYKASKYTINGNKSFNQEKFKTASK